VATASDCVAASLHYPVMSEAPIPFLMLCQNATGGTLPPKEIPAWKNSSFRRPQKRISAVAAVFP
jgi:hypothetical protein